MDYNLLTKNYDIIPTYSYQTKEHNAMTNITLILFVVIILFILVYIVFYSDSYKIRVNVS